MTTRIKITTPSLRTRAEAEACLGEIRALTIEQRGIQARREQALKDVDDIFADDLDAVQRALAAKGDQLLAWAEANSSEFAGRKTLDLTHGVIGWRTGMPKLVKRTKDAWDALVERVRAHLGGGFVRTKEEVDREAIIASRDALDAAALRACGLAVVQEEAFFIEPRIEEQDATLKPASPA